jgi:hypothetical protein
VFLEASNIWQAWRLRMEVNDRYRFDLNADQGILTGQDGKILFAPPVDRRILEAHCREPLVEMLQCLSKEPLKIVQMYHKYIV